MKRGAFGIFCQLGLRPVGRGGDLSAATWKRRHSTDTINEAKFLGAKPDSLSPSLSLTFSLPLSLYLSLPLPLSQGLIKTALPGMDREVKENYQVVIQAKDMAGQMGGLSGTTTVCIALSDVNDNPPRFTKSELEEASAHLLPVSRGSWIRMVGRGGAGGNN